MLLVVTIKYLLKEEPVKHSLKKTDHEKLENRDMTLTMIEKSSKNAHRSSVFKTAKTKGEVSSQDDESAMSHTPRRRLFEDEINLTPPSTSVTKRHKQKRSTHEE